MVEGKLSLFVLTAVMTLMIGIGKCEEAPSGCEENMEWKECASCQKTCDDVANMGEPRVCTAVCKAGCSCVSGYVLEKGGCIPEGNCTCKQNAEYKCYKCGRTCDDVTSMGPPMLCSDLCRYGCDCIDGYFLLSGECVPQKDCPCQEYAQYSQCGARCRLTCVDVADMSPKMCPFICAPGCVCQDGYALDSEECVPKTQCPCKEHAQHKEDATCRITCEQSNTGDSQPCREYGEAGDCYCDAGYALNATVCIPQKECP